MSDTNRSRVQAGLREGGQFAVEHRTESDLVLTAPAPARHRVDVHASVLLDVTPAVEVPQWPSSLGEPEIDYDRDVEGDGLTLTITTDRTGPVQFWSTSGADHSFDHGLYEGEPLSAKERDELIAYGRAVFQNVDVAHFGLEETLTRSAKGDVVALATGRRPAGDERETAPATFGAQRAERVMRAWVDEVDTEPETAVKDALTDLVHFARSRGLAIEDILDDAQHAADEEENEEADLAAPRAGGSETDYERHILTYGR